MTLVDDKVQYRPMDAVRPEAKVTQVLGPKVRARDVSVFYAEKQALHSVSIDIPQNQVTAFIKVKVT